MVNYREKFKQINQLFQQNPTQTNYSAISQLYELKAELEQRQTNNQNDFDDDMVLFAVYNNLRLYKSALHIFMKHNDIDDPKNLNKFYKVGGKANSHGDKFALKNIKQATNQLKKRKVKINLSLTDFVPSNEYDFGENANQQAFFIKKAIPIFWRNFKDSNNKIDVIVPLDKLDELLPAIQNTIEYIAFFDKQSLINHYNNPPKNPHSHTVQFTQKHADDNWFNTLEIYRFLLDFSQPDMPICYISVGDIYDLDHILDMEFWNKEFARIGYDG